MSNLIKRLPYLIDLDCEECGKHIGMTYEFDLNGSDFFCDECVAKAREEKPE